MFFKTSKQTSNFCINLSKIFTLFNLFFLFLGFQTHAINYTELGKPNSYVTDEAKVLNTSEKQELENRLKQIDQAGNGQGAIVLVQNLDGYDVETYANNLFRQWGIGDKEKNNGFLVLISVGDKKSRIEVGRGIEDKIVDGQAGNILRKSRSFFAKGEFKNGLIQVLDEIEILLNKDGVGSKEKTNKNSFLGLLKHLPQEFFIWILTLIPALLVYLASSKSWWLGGVLGGGMGAIIGLISHSFWAGLLWGIPLAILGFVVDYFLSKKHAEAKKHGETGDDIVPIPFFFGSSGGSGSNKDFFSGFDGGDSGGGGASDSF